jgi:6-phosphofructokinase 2
MKKIITITVNPTIDKSIAVPMWEENTKLRCSEIQFEPGGGGINISRALKNLGGTSNTLFFAGGFFGAYFKKIFKEKKISYTAFTIKNETR